MTKAYIKNILPNTEDSHQTSPHWLISFIRFANRDTKNYTNFEGNRDTRRPFIVENDCISVAVSTSKTNFTPSVTMTFLGGDINYATAFAPGDFVTVNMVNSSEKARELRDKVSRLKPINQAGDGFKGIFKINNINKIIQTNPETGVKILRYQVTGYGFTEFNNIIYYNPTLGNSIDKDVLTYQINKDLLTILNNKKSIQEVLQILPNIIIGNGTVNVTNPKVLSTKKEPYIIPKDVFFLLGLSGNNAVDLYRIMIGVWAGFRPNANNVAEGFEPKYTEDGGNQIMSKTLSGRIPIQTSPLTNVKLVDLLKRYLNPLINEMYFCYRLDRTTNSVIPKVIIRQKPFNTLHGQLGDTKFLELPRWKVSPDLIYSINISKNESLRFNFVHIIGTTGNPSIDGANLAFQNANKSTVIADKDDIQRHGLRPYTQVSNFDWPSKENSTSYAPQWAKLVFDWVYGGHLKANGTVSCVGIEDDICVGDNFELQDTVFHIEEVSHVGSVLPDGKKTFRTNLTLSHGVDKRSSINGPVYPEMDYTDTLTDRKNDYQNDYGILPGFSDTQDIRGRKDGEEIDETKEKSFTPTGIKRKVIKNTKKEK